MTWRATKNALAGLLAGLAGGVLLGGLIVIWGAAVFSLAAGPGGWAHAALYVAVAVLIPALVPWVVQGLSALQRSRLRAMLGAEIPAARSAPWAHRAPARVPPAGSVHRAGRAGPAGAPVPRLLRGWPSG